MSSTTLQVLHVEQPSMPRGARVAADLFVRASRWLASRPATPHQTRVQEAEAVREYAYSVQRSDPRFAADLYAAADRHEMGEASPTSGH
jgi:hypothetical protein